MQTVQPMQETRITKRKKPQGRPMTVARKLLRRLGATLVAHADDPAADPRTMAEQARQTAGLVMAELKEGGAA